MHSNALVSRRQAGFTILEMSVVLVVIALIIGAVSVGRDLYRSAVAERIGSEFVQGWMVAYDRYVAQVGAVPGDSLVDPSGRVRNAVNTELCDADLRDAMLTRGISLPQGRAEGMETRYVYQDSNGQPQELEICFINIANWAEPSSGTTYALRSRNVMRMSGLTSELAHKLDSRFDGRIDARFGRLRELGSQSYTGGPGSPPDEGPWSRNERQINEAPDAWIPTVTAYLKMNQ